MVLVGLTGGIGSGKSTVSALLAARGAEVVDADAIVHPAVGAEIARRLEEAAGTDRVVVLDVPLLVESGRDDMAALLVVDVDPEVAVRRVVEQRAMREDDVRARMARQASREDRLARATIVIDNSGSREDLERRVDEVWEQIQAL